MRNLLKSPTPEQVDCQKPKPILLDTGEMSEPYPWAVTISSHETMYMCVQIVYNMCIQAFKYTIIEINHIKFFIFTY